MAAFIDEDMNIHHINTFCLECLHGESWVFFDTHNLFGKKWKIFVMYCRLVYFMFWNSVLVVAARTSHLVLVEFGDSFLSSCFQESEHWAFSCRLTWERSTSGFWVVRTSFLVLVWLPCPSSTFSGLTGYPKAAEDFPSRSTGYVTPSWRVRLRPNHWSWFRDRWNFTEVASWPLFDMALCIRSDQKENYWNGCKRTSRNSVGLDMCLIVELLPLIIILMTGFVLFKDVQLRLTFPHLSIDQQLGCSFHLVFWSWFCCSNGFLSRTSFLELV